MKHDTTLTVTSLLAVLLFTLHLASDVVLGKDEFDRGMWIGVLLLAAWLYGAVALRGRVSGYVVLMLFSLLGMAVVALHTPAAGMSAEFVRSPGAYLFIWTLLALGATAAVSFVLCVQGLWSRRRQTAVVSAHSI